MKKITNRIVRNPSWKRVRFARRFHEGSPQSQRHEKTRNQIWLQAFVIPNALCFYVYVFFFRYRAITLFNNIYKFVYFFVNIKKVRLFTSFKFNIFDLSWKFQLIYRAQFCLKNYFSSYFKCWYVWINLKDVNFLLLYLFVEKSYSMVIKSNLSHKLFLILWCVFLY